MSWPTPKLVMYTNGDCTLVSIWCTIHGVLCTKRLLLTVKGDVLDRDGKGLAHAVVLKLLEITRDVHMYMDNWYGSPTLFGDLHRQGFDATETVRTDRHGRPLVMKATIKKNNIIKAHFGNLMVIKWMDKRTVCILTVTI